MSSPTRNDSIRRLYAKEAREAKKLSAASKAANDAALSSNVIGAEWERVRYEIQFRKADASDKDRGWYRTHGPVPKTMQEAIDELSRVGQPMEVAGMRFTFAGPKTKMEYRIVKTVAQCRIVHVCEKMI